MAVTASTPESATPLRTTRMRRRPTRAVALIAMLSFAASTATAVSASAETVITPVLTASTGEIDLVLERQVGTVNYGFGQDEWQVYLLTARNLSSADVTIGLGVDLDMQGVVEDLRYSGTMLAISGTEGDLTDVFSATIPPGRPSRPQCPTGQV